MAKNSMNIFLDDFLEVLPTGWRFDRFKDVTTLRNEKTNIASEEKDYLELEDIESGTGRILGWRDTLEVESAVTLFQKGDVLFGKLRPYLEKYYEAEIDGKCTGEILAFKPERIYGRFLFYCLGSRWFVRRCNALAYGAKMPRVNWATQLAQFNFPLPPLPEQERIANYLDKSCVAIDAAVKAKQGQIEILNDVRKAIISRAVTQGTKENIVFQSTGNVWLEKVPQGWGLTALKRVSEIQTGLTLGKTYEGELVELPYLRVANVQDGHLDLSEVTLIEVPPDVAARVQLRAGDVLMTEGGDLDKLGRGYLWKGEIPNCLHQNHIFAVRCFQHKLLPSYLAHLTASKHGRDYFEATGKRTTNLASTSSKKVGQFPIPLPSLSEQQEICDYIEQKNTEIRELIDTIEKQVNALLAYRKSLIHECVTGQRRV